MAKDHLTFTKKSITNFSFPNNLEIGELCYGGMMSLV